VAKAIDVTGRSREELLIIAERACSALVGIANNVTTDEGDKDATEDDFGIDASEVIEMAHDNMITRARSTLDSIVREFPKR
jgi:hypothetical protein